VDSNSNFLII